jgi:hypothetical protein
MQAVTESVIYKPMEKLLQTATKLTGKSMEKIFTDQMKATGEAASTTPSNVEPDTSEIFERGIESKLAPIKFDRVLEIYKLVYGLATKMRGTPLLYAEKAGDRRVLAAFIRSEPFLSYEIRQYIADLVENPARTRQRNKPTRQPKRPPSAEVARRNRTLVWFILRARASGTGPDASIDAAVDRFNAGGRRNVQEIFRINKEHEPELLATTELAIKRIRELGRDLEAIAN